MFLGAPVRVCFCFAVAVAVAGRARTEKNEAGSGMEGFQAFAGARVGPTAEIR